MAISPLKKGHLFEIPGFFFHPGIGPGPGAGTTPGGLGFAFTVGDFPFQGKKSGKFVKN